MPFWEPSKERKPASGVALTLLTLFFAFYFPYTSGLEIPRPAVQLFYCCSAPVYLDLAMTRWRAPHSAWAAWGIALLVQLVALAVVRIKVGHWVWPSAIFLGGAATLGLGVAVGASYLAEFWSGSVARQVYLFGAIALFLFWRMVAPDGVQVSIDSLLLPDTMPIAGALGGATIAALGWLVYGREPQA
jgi:hypothetical protein